LAGGRRVGFKIDKPVESFMAKGAYLYSEAQLAIHLGVPRKDLTSIRIEKLKKNVHWKIIKGEVALNLAGIAHLLTWMDIPCGRVDPTQCYFPEPKKNEPILLLMDRGQAPTVVKMRVRRLFPNPMLIEAVEVARPTQLQQVRVKANDNFTIGMQFDAIPDVGNPGFWILAGPLPRYRGRW